MEEIETIESEGAAARERTEWLAERRGGIGGSDAAAILGLSPWETEFDVWLAKRGEVKERPDAPHLWWGRELEPAIAKRYQVETGRRLYAPNQILRHPTIECIAGTPDRIVLGQRRGVELKTANVYMADKWGESGSDDIPQQYVVQCLVYCAITGFPAWDVALLMGGSDFRIYTVERDEAFEAEMLARLADWWTRHVVEGVAPVMTESDTTKEWLRSKFPNHRDGARIVASQEANEIAAQYIAAREVEEAAEHEASVMANRLRMIVGDAEGIDGNGWRLTYRKAAGSRKVDWEAVARETLTALELFVATMVAARTKPRDADEIDKAIVLQEWTSQKAAEFFAEVVKRRTTQGAGGRRFLLKQAKGDQ